MKPSETPIHLGIVPMYDEDEQNHSGFVVSSATDRLRQLSKGLSAL